MTAEERIELEELEKLAQEEKKDLEQIKAFESLESTDLSRFEKEIAELEQETDTLYLKKLAPDLYKVQNYVLWALQKGLSPEQVKENLLKRGWKDKELIEMIIDDVLKYKGYYVEKKGKVLIPELKTEQPERIEEKVTTKLIEKQPVVVHKTIITTKKPKEKKTKKTKAKASKITRKRKKKDGLTKVEKTLDKLEKDLEKEKKTQEKSPKKKSKKTKTVKTKTSKKTVSKKSTKKATIKKRSKKSAKTKKKKETIASVILHADKDVNVQVQYK
jgi:hypothetical protein